MFNLNLYNICELYGFADHNFGDIGLKYDQLIFVAIAMWLYLLISTSTSLYLCIVNDALRVPYLLGTQ